MLNFIYGTMASGKTLELLKTRFNYNEAGLSTISIAIDDDKGSKKIKSRALNAEITPDILLSKNDNIYKLLLEKSVKIDAIFIDESQFLTIEQIHQLKEFSNKANHKNIDIYCYGLLTNTKNKIWKTSQELILLSDDTKEIKSRCQLCGQSNAKHHVKDKTKSWDDKNSYKSVCFECWKKYN